jgi:hypothetical protein
LSEIATPGQKGFYVSWQSASQQVAVMFAALLGMVLNATLSPAKMGRPAGGRPRHGTWSGSIPEMSAMLDTLRRLANKDSASLQGGDISDKSDKSPVADPLTH